MFLLMVKALMAVILTAIPFVFHGVVRPKQATSKRWKNFYSLMASLKPQVRRFMKKVEKLVIECKIKER